MRLGCCVCYVPCTCCLLCVVCRVFLVCAARCVLRGVRCSVRVVSWLLLDDWCLIVVGVHCVLCCRLFDARCALFVSCRRSRCLLFVV